MSARRRMARIFSGVDAGGVHLGLADLGDQDGEPGQRLAHGSLKCSAQFSCWPAGSGTAVSGRPMCSAKDGSDPAEPGAAGRSRPRTGCAWRGTPCLRISSATKCGTISSRRFPRWTGPDGLIPDAHVGASPGCLRSASARTSPAVRTTQSSARPRDRTPPSSFRSHQRTGLRGSARRAAAGAKSGLEMPRPPVMAGRGLTRISQTWVRCPFPRFLEDRMIWDTR